MGDGIKAFWLGVFILITVGLAAWLLLFLRPSVGDCGTELTVRFTNIQSVSIGTRVSFAGKPVGEVTKIETIADARENPPNASGDIYFYELKLCVDSSVQIYSYDEIIFSTQGLLGEKTIAIIPKATPHGEPPATLVTHDVLYGSSMDTLEETLAQLSSVGEVFERAMENINDFIDINMDDFHETLVHISEAAESFNTFVDKVNQNEFTERAVKAADAIASTMKKADNFFENINDSGLVGKITNGKGTIGRLLNSDSFYLQMQAVMCKMETVLSDISNYGLLFQYDRSWKRKRIVKEHEMQQICSPKLAAQFFNREMCEVENTLDRVSSLLYKMPCEPDPCFEQAFRELLGRVEHLQRSLQNYNEMMFNNYCERSN